MRSKLVQYLIDEFKDLDLYGWCSACDDDRDSCACEKLPPAPFGYQKPGEGYDSFFEGVLPQQDYEDVVWFNFSEPYSTWIAGIVEGDDGLFYAATASGCSCGTSGYVSEGCASAEAALEHVGVTDRGYLKQQLNDSIVHLTRPGVW